MKTHHVLCVLAVFAALLFGCQVQGAWLGSPAGEAAVPPDLVTDVARSYDGEFRYQTLLPVEINLTVELYEQAAKTLEPLTAADHLVVVTLSDSAGNPVYAGRIPPTGNLTTTLTLPAAPEDMVLTLEAPGFEKRSVTIRDMVGLSSLRRTMSLVRSAVAARSLDLADRDEDGIPDVYDAYPDDPEVAFSVREPADGQLTVAYEDLYPSPGDADYNDFVAEYVLIENYKNVAGIQEIADVLGKDAVKPSACTMLKSLRAEVTAVAKIAGRNHMFGIVVEYPGITPEKISVSYRDLFGAQRSAELPPMPDKAIIWLFLNTRYAVGKSASFDIVFPDGVDRSQVSQIPYDPVLKILPPNKSYDIHLIGRDPLPGSLDKPGETFMDANGYPWALLVPDDWQHPAETQYIGKAYPLFDAWREARGADFAYWYLYPAASNTKPGNLAPYPVTGPTTTPVFQRSAASAFQLDIAAPAGQPDDPDGDRVYFRSSLVPPALAAFFSLNADTGLVSFTPGAPKGSYAMYFWSEDEYGASTLATPYRVNFTFLAEPVLYPRVVIDSYKPTGAGFAAADTFISLFGPEGDSTPGFDDAPPVSLAEDDNGNPIFANYARIDYTGGLMSGTYYVRVRGADALQAGAYALRVVTAVDPAVTLEAQYPAAEDWFFAATNPDDSPYEPDDDPPSGGLPTAPADLTLDGKLNRYLSAGDVDWIRVELP